MNGSRVLVSGVAYKADIDDMRESPALDIIRLLRDEGAIVEYHDPYVERFDFEGDSYESVDLNRAFVESCDLVVIVTAHKDIDYEQLLDNASLIVDTRNALAGNQSEKISRI